MKIDEDYHWDLKKALKENKPSGDNYATDEWIMELFRGWFEKPKCDECGTELEKTFITTEFGNPVVVFVCPKSEMFQLYQKEFEEKRQSGDDMK